MTVLGHPLWYSAPLVWCAKCGHHGERRIKLLKTRCKGKAVTQSERRVRNWLQRGLHPRDKRPLEPAKRISRALWLDLTGLARGRIVAPVLEELEVEWLDDPGRIE